MKIVSVSGIHYIVNDSGMNALTNQVFNTLEDAEKVMSIIKKQKEDKDDGPAEGTVTD